MIRHNIFLISALTASTVLMATQLTKAQNLQKADFSGTWVLDLPKSEFGDVPTYTAPKQMKVIQTAEELKIEFVTVSDSGADSTAVETLSTNGNPLVITGGDHRKRKITAKLFGDGNVLTIRVLASEQDNPESQQFDSIENWTLAAGAALVVDKNVEVADGGRYGTRTVYDRK